jgi:hypothetical protein
LSKGALFAPCELRSARSGEKRKGKSAAPGRPFFWSLFFGQAKKSDLPWVSHPQLGFEIARQARDTIYTLDLRLRGDDTWMPAFAGMTTNIAEACPRML